MSVNGRPRRRVASATKLKNGLAVVPALRSGEVGEEFGSGLDAGNKQPVAGAGTGDVEQVALGVVNLVEFGFVGDGFDALLQGQNIVIAGHDGDGLVLKPFSKVHGADGNPALRLLKTFGEFQLCVTGGFHGGTCAGKLIVRPYEQPDLGGSDSVCHGFLDPVGNARDFPFGIAVCLDFRIGAIEYRHGAAPVLFVPVNVLHDLGQKTVGRLPDLVRGSIVDLKRARTPANIDTKRLP